MDAPTCWNIRIGTLSRSEDPGSNYKDDELKNASLLCIVNPPLLRVASENDELHSAS